jgi:hypothetical protein
MTDNGYYSESVHGPHEVYDLGDFPLEMGETLRNAKLRYCNGLTNCHTC